MGTLLRIDALAIVDGEGTHFAPGSMLLDDGTVAAIGRPADVDRHPAAQRCPVLSRPRSVVFPGLVNAHAHLDLTHIGPREHDPASGFAPWIDMIRRERKLTAPEIAASVRRGIELSLAGGTAAIGDIAGSTGGTQWLTPWEELQDSGLVGVSYLECFGIGPGQPEAAARLTAFLEQQQERIAQSQSASVRIGVQPHAPITVNLAHYALVVEWAKRLGAPLATHLAESFEEREFVAKGRGPQRELLRSLRMWDDGLLREFGRGRHPVEHLSGVLAAGGFLVAHVNDADDAAIETLARTGTSVAYCPRASAYFGAERHFGPHRYREMLARGINVALGTDSIVNLPHEAATEGGGGISILDEMRFLWRRDGGRPEELLRMATTNGAKAMGLPLDGFRFRAGSRPRGVLAIDVSDAAGAGAEENALNLLLRSRGGPGMLFWRKRLERVGQPETGSRPMV